MIFNIVEKVFFFHLRVTKMEIKCITIEGSYKKLQPFFKDFRRTTLDFQGLPTRNIITDSTKTHIPSLF